MLQVPSSPFTRHFDTNYAPSPHEINQINELLLHLENLRKLDEEILRLQDERTRLQTFIDNHRVILSPFRRIPADIWRMIFPHCLPPSEFPVRVITEAPLLLTRICRSWREIALTTPVLWNAIHVHVSGKPLKSDDEWYAAKMQARIEGVKRWLERSGSLPLRISLSVATFGPLSPQGHPDNQSADKPAADLAALLLPYSSRWQTLSLNRVPCSILESLLGDNVDVPILQRIYFRGLSKQKSEIVLRLLEKTRGNHIILRIDIYDLPDLIHPPFTNPHWARLTQLDVFGQFLPTDHFLPRLGELCPSLTACTLTFSDLPDDYFGGRIQFSTPLKESRWNHLHKLDITIQNLWRGRARMNLIPNILKFVNAPLLTEFRIAYHSECDFTVDEPDPVTESPFHQFLLRSGCEESLTHLIVDFPIRHPEVLVQSLAALPSLKFLRIGQMPNVDRLQNPTLMSSRAPLDKQLFQALTSTSICPLLEELEFSICSPSHIDALLNLAKAREPRYFTVNFDEQSEWGATVLNSEHVNQNLEVLRLKGVRVGWHWHASPVESPYYGLL